MMILALLLNAICTGASYTSGIVYDAYDKLPNELIQTICDGGDDALILPGLQTWWVNCGEEIEKSIHHFVVTEKIAQLDEDQESRTLFVRAYIQEWDNGDYASRLGYTTYKELKNAIQKISEGRKATDIWWLWTVLRTSTLKLESCTAVICGDTMNSEVPPLPRLSPRTTIELKSEIDIGFYAIVDSEMYENFPKGTVVAVRFDELVGKQIICDVHCSKTGEQGEVQRTDLKPVDKIWTFIGTDNVEQMERFHKFDYEWRNEARKQKEAKKRAREDAERLATGEAVRLWREEEEKHNLLESNCDPKKKRDNVLDRWVNSLDLTYRPSDNTWLADLKREISLQDGTMVKQFLKRENLERLFETKLFATEKPALTKMLDKYSHSKNYKKFLGNKDKKTVENAFKRAFSLYFHPDKVEMTIKDQGVQDALICVYKAAVFVGDPYWGSNLKNSE